jgi:hypothetical protein
MSMRFGRVSPALALAVGALAIAGCGGGSSGGSGSTGTGTSASATGATLTPKQWEAKVEGISTELSAAFAPIKTQGHSPETWFTLSNQLKQINSDVATIKPPPVAAGLTSAIAAGLAPLPQQAEAIGNDLKSGNQTQARADAVTLEKSLFKLLSDISSALLKLKGGGTTT